MKYAIYILIALVVIAGLIAAAGMYKFNYLANQPGYSPDGNKITVTNYDECEAAGYPVLESYPEQCSDGQTTFVNQFDADVPDLDDGEEGSAETGVTPDTPADSDVIIGMTVAAAEAYASEQGLPFRIGFQDGEPFALTLDYRPGRITASVENGIVTDYSVE